MTRYRCVAARKAEGFAVTHACDAAEVSRSAFYDWAAQPDGPTQAEVDEAYLIDEIVDIHRTSGGTYGQPRVTPELARRGWVANHKRVERLMADNGIVGHHPRKRRSLTKPDEGAPPLPDLVGRLFDPDEPDHTWVGDITYVPTGEGWLYLASVIDLASRRLIGWSMGDRHDSSLVADALTAAVGARGVARMVGTIFHSDRGAEYTAADYRALCRQLGVAQSVGRTGSCLDNAVAESFFARLKVELVHRQTFATRDQARRAIFRWIAFYNHRRLHSTLDYLPPIEWELAHQTSPPVASITAAA